MKEREAGRYEFPVPSREAVLAYLTKSGEPVSLKTIAEDLGINDERDLDAFARRLRAMERDGQLLKNRRGRYGLIQKMDMICGRIMGHAEGFGFLIPDEGGDDLFISPREMRQVFHGDRVLARLTSLDARGRKEGAIVEVLERAQQTIVGRYFCENQVGFVVPEDKRSQQHILIPPSAEAAARNQQIVMVEIIEQPTRQRQAVGRIVEVLGDHMAPGMEIEVAIRKYGLPHVWPQSVEQEVAGLDSSRGSEEGAVVAEEDKRGREDLRSVPLVTIDGEDARDFDDAVFCERKGKGWRLIVAIADVSHYVKPGTALDKEGYARGNSVYFPNNVIPMLPEILSNGLCSLKPAVDRLCMACEMQIDAKGKVQAFRFFEGVMRSQARLTYSSVAAMLVEKDVALRRQYHDLLPHLEELYALFKTLQKVRKQRGSVDFELPETRIIYNIERKIERIVPVVRNDAHKLIEECMLAANVCAAELLSKAKVPAPYRIHAGPTLEKLADLRRFLFELGLKLGGGDAPQAKDYAKLLASLGTELEVSPQARLIQTMLLRSLSQAVYSPENVGHFALAYPHYTHFTSPIRRYPDLLVHRLIKEMLKKSGSLFAKAKNALFQKNARSPTSGAAVTMKLQSEHCSMTERRADDATRDVTRWLKTEYMSDKIGQEFAGVISGVTNFGLFVELVDIYVDGLVHISALGNDYYHFDPALQRLQGEHTHKTYRLGDSVRIKLLRADLDDAKLDFELVEDAAAGGKRRERHASGDDKKPKKRPRRRR